MPYLNVEHKFIAVPSQVVDFVRWFQQLAVVGKCFISVVSELFLIWISCRRLSGASYRITLQQAHNHSVEMHGGGCRLGFSKRRCPLVPGWVSLLVYTLITPIVCLSRWFHVASRCSSHPGQLERAEQLSELHCTCVPYNYRCRGK